MGLRKRSRIQWFPSVKIRTRVRQLAKSCELDYIRANRIFCYSSTGAATRAYARIWGLNRIWQTTLGTEPAYILEVIAEKFNKLSTSQQDHILIHELLHIPKNFSGALVAHKRKGGVNDRRVNELYAQHIANRK